MGQERSLARLTELKGRKDDSGVYAILIPEGLTGYCFVEGENQMKIENSFAGIRVISSRAVGNKEVPLDDLLSILDPRPSIEGLEEGDVVEIISGPFKGLKAKLTRIEGSSQEITAELLDSTMALPVRIHADHVKKLHIDETPEKDQAFGKFTL
jgi:transcriptional antiterminator NusG